MPARSIPAEREKTAGSAVRNESAAHRHQGRNRDSTAANDVRHTLNWRVRGRVLKFGRLLEAWPDLVEAAKRLRANGRRRGQAALVC